MAEEKNVMFAVLAVVVLVTAIGLVYMLKAGPGRSTFQPATQQAPSSFTITSEQQVAAPPVQAEQPPKDERDWYEFLAAQIKSAQQGGSFVGNFYNVINAFNQRSPDFEARFVVSDGTVTVVLAPKGTFTKQGITGIVRDNLSKTSRITNVNFLRIGNDSCNSAADVLERIIKILITQSSNGSLSLFKAQDKGTPRIVFASTFTDFFGQDVRDWF